MTEEAKFKQGDKVWYGAFDHHFLVWGYAREYILIGNPVNGWVEADPRHVRAY